MRLRPSATVLRWTIGILVGVVVLAWFTSPDPVNLDDDGDAFTGRWLINGEDPFGTEYSGSLTISASGTQYRLDWIVNGALLEGTGRRVGSELLVEWSGAVGGRDVTGGATYTVSGESIDGEITIDGETQAGKEDGELAR